MKKRIIISLSALLMLFLVFRIINSRFSTIDSERQSYFDQLDLEFSGLIDSVVVEDKNHGLLFFHITAGYADVVKEAKLNSQLDFDKKFLFLVELANNKFEIAIHNPMPCTRGDSLYISTDKNLISVFRHGNQITSEPAILALRGSKW
jgi:hypothetical protein